MYPVYGVVLQYLITTEEDTRLKRRNAGLSKDNKSSKQNLTAGLSENKQTTEGSMKTMLDEIVSSLIKTTA